MYAVEFETDIKDRFIEIQEFEKLANRHVKVIILAEETNIDEKKEISLGGCLKQYANPALISNEKVVGLEKAMKEKYDLS